MIKNKIGDILNASEEIIIHQVNCQGVMGGGLARQIAIKYPHTEQQYKKICEEAKYNYRLLKGFMYLSTEEDHSICNIFCQRPNFDTDYQALEEGLKKIKGYCKESKRTMAIPYKIGCGIANGEWNIVYKIIEEVFSDYEVTLYKLEV